MISIGKLWTASYGEFRFGDPSCGNITPNLVKSCGAEQKLPKKVTKDNQSTYMVFFAELPKHYKDEIKDPFNIIIRI